MAKIYYSTDKVWWNTGNEIKPNREAFNKFRFNEAQNFNISWIDELTINVIVPNNNLCTLIKIEDNIDNITKYFYLLSVNNRTTANQDCTYELDVWLTYLLPYLEAQNNKAIRTIRTLDVQKVSKNINIEPVGVPTGNIVFKRIPFVPNHLGDVDRNGHDFDYPDNDMLPTPGVHTNIYYVFKSRDIFESHGPFTAFIKYTKKKYVLPTYVLIPVLNICGFGFEKHYTYYDVGAASNTTGQTKYPLLNSEHNLRQLAKTSADYTSQGIGDFIGVWVGPNYFRLKDKGLAVPLYQYATSIGQDRYLYSQDIFMHDIAGRGFWVPNYIVDPSATRAFDGVFLAARVSAIPLGMTPLYAETVSNRSDLLEGYQYQNNPDNNLTFFSEFVNFNNAFLYSNGRQTTTTNLALPAGYDAYYNLLAQQRNTLNTSLGLSGLNSMITGASAIPGFIPPEPSTTTNKTTTLREVLNTPQLSSSTRVRNYTTGRRGGRIPNGYTTTKSYTNPTKQILKTTRDLVSTTAAGFSLANPWSAGITLARAGAQFISTLAEQNAYRADLRKSISTAVLNENDAYLNWFLIAKAFVPLKRTTTERIDWQAMMELLAQEIISGAETEPGTSYRFYGVDSQPRLITVSNNMEAYIKVDENTALILQNTWGISYTPIIKEAMLTLLSEGIRVSGGVIQ